MKKIEETGLTNLTRKSVKGLTPSEATYFARLKKMKRKEQGALARMSPSGLVQI